MMDMKRLDANLYDHVINYYCYQTNQRFSADI